MFASLLTQEEHRGNNSRFSNKFTSSTFAICTCIIGWLVNKQCTGDIMKDRFHILDNYLTFGVPYFLYDLVSMYAVHSTQVKDSVTVSSREILQFLRARPLIVFHHLLVPVLAFLLGFRNGGDCLIGSFLMIEASTPFVSARVILVHLNMKVGDNHVLVTRFRLKSHI